MARKEVINLAGAESRPYSSAIRAGDFIYTSGAVGHVDAQGNPVEGLEAQPCQCLENIKSALEAAGASLSDVIKVTVFLSNKEAFNTINELFKAHFPEDPPARSTVITGLPNPDMLVEMECIAYYSSE